MLRNLRITLSNGQPPKPGEHGSFVATQCKIEDLDNPGAEIGFVQALSFEMFASDMLPQLTLTVIPNSVEIVGPLTVDYPVMTADQMRVLLLRGRTFGTAEGERLIAEIKQCMSASHPSS